MAMAQLAQLPTESQLRHHFDALVRRGAFKPILRFLPAGEVGAELLQDAVAQTWGMFRRYALEKGKVVPDAILVFSCRQRAIDPNRSFVPADGVQRLRDAYDWRNFASGRVVIHRLDLRNVDQHIEDAGEGDRELIGLAAALNSNPTRNVHSALDLESWLDQLHEDDRAMLEARAAGFTLEETAADRGLSISTVHSRTKQLGEQLAARAGVALRGRARSEADVVLAAA
jgi:hypothetical protein